MKRLIGLLCAVGLLAVAAPSRADDPHFGLFVSQETAKGESLRLRTLRGGAEASLPIAPGLRLLPALQVTQSELRLRQFEGTPFDATLAGPDSVAIGLHVNADLLHIGPLRIEAEVGGVLPLSEERFALSDFTPQGELAEEPITADLMRPHVDVRRDWAEANVGLRIVANLRAFKPFVGADLRFVDDAVKVTLDEVSRPIFDGVSSTPERTYDNSRIFPLLRYGATLEVYPGVSIGAEGSYMQSDGASISGFGFRLHVAPD